MRRYPGGGAFALFFHPHPREFATQNKNSANARGLARGGGWAQLELTDALLYWQLHTTVFRSLLTPRYSMANFHLVANVVNFNNKQIQVNPFN